MKQERVRCGDICGFAAKVWFSGGRERVCDCRADTSWWFECPCGSKLHIVAEVCGNSSVAACREGGGRAKKSDNRGGEIVEVVKRRNDVAE